MERVYKNIDEVRNYLEVVPVLDGYDLRLDVYLDGKQVGSIDRYNKEIRTKVNIAKEDKDRVEKYGSNSM